MKSREQDGKGRVGILKAQIDGAASRESLILAAAVATEKAGGGCASRRCS